MNRSLPVAALMMAALSALPGTASAQEKPREKPLFSADVYVAPSTTESRLAEQEVKAGRIRLSQKEYARAAQHFKTAADLWPTSAAYEGLGLALLDLGDHEGAVAAYRTLYDGTPLKMGGNSQDADVLFAFAAALSKTVRDAEALDVCRRAMQTLMRSTGELPVPLPDLGGGSGGVNRFVSRPALQAIAHIGFALHLNGMGSPTEEQLDHARTAAQAQPNAGWAHYYYGRALVKRDVAKTPADWKKARAELDLADKLGNAATRKAVEELRASLPSALK